MRASRFDHQPIRWRHRARVGEDVVRRRLFHFDSRDEQSIEVGGAQNAQPHGDLRAARAGARPTEAERVLLAAVVRRHNRRRAQARLCVQAGRETKAGDCGRQRIPQWNPAAALQRRRVRAQATEEDDVQPRRSILVVARLEWHERAVVQDGRVRRGERLSRAGAHRRGHPDLANLLDESRLRRERWRRPLGTTGCREDDHRGDEPSHGFSSRRRRFVAMSKT